ncbi:unnamed protein product [Coffea canephora]|uniref:Uncharacterized protein n=2 Tax=Coffea TaxID=13442 RepID=A0A068TZG8_COFCA|nr:unnamed protein product [Coffea canephora]
MSSFGQAAVNLLRKLWNSPYARSTFPFSRKPTNYLPVPGRRKYFAENGFGDYGRSGQHKETFQWILLSGQAAIFLGINGTPALADDSSIQLSSENTSGPEIADLRQVEDGSVVSNIHTSKWRVFTDNARDFFLQGKLDEAEKLFLSALQEAKEGFGKRDPHVASACNNLAELYRVKKELNKAEPLYLEAISILEESFGPDDIRVGAALHNLGQFYLVQRKLEKARACYERALKIKRRVLGEGHPDHADTMYHLGTVMFLEGKEKDAEALVRDSVRILEEAGLGESFTCLRRLQYLAQIYTMSNQIAEAENIQRKILHRMELSKGWTSLDTVIAAERLALTLQSVVNLKEAEELLERCLDARKTLLPEDHIETAANMLYIARVKKLKSNQLRKKNVPQAMEELERAKGLLSNSIRVARKVLVQLRKQNRNQQPHGVVRNIAKNEHSAMLILLQSLNALASLEITKLELQESMDEDRPVFEAEKILHECMSTFKEFGTETSLSSSPEVKTEYLSCLKHLLALINDNSTASVKQSRKAALEELKDEIKHVEVEISATRKRRS